MSVRAPRRPDPPAPDRRARRRDVERQLAGHGLIPGPRRVGLAAEAPEDRVARARRLAGALAGLGPAFAGFGRYLATRADVLLPAECRELAAIPDRAPAAPAEAIARRLREELGAPPEELFASFDPEAARAGLFVQVHRATLAGGHDVEVRVVRPGAERAAVRDLPLLDLLARAWPPRELPIDELLTGYRAELELRFDLRREAEALGDLAADAAGSDLLAVPEVHRHLSTGAVLTVERPAGLPLAAWHGQDAARAELCRRLCRVWLEQATAGGGRIPLAMDLRAFEDGSLLVAGGRFVGCAASARANLAAYLRAAAAGDPDGAYRRLAAEVVAGPEADPVELRRRVRQAMPLREMPLEDGGERLGEQLVVHWRLIRECGYRPRPELAAFYRGLFRLLEQVREIEEPGTDREPLREALEDLEWLAAWAELGRFADLPRLAESFEGYLEAAVRLPPRLDRALQRALIDETPLPAPAPRPPRPGEWRTAAGLALAAFAVALVTAEIAANGARAWVEGAGAIALLGLGAGLLRVLWRGP